MEKSNEASNLGTNIPEASTTQNSVPQQSVNILPLNEPFGTKKWLIPTLIGAVLLSLGIAGYFAYQNYQIKQQGVQPTPAFVSTLPSVTATPTTVVPTTAPTLGWETYSNASAGFSIKYPKGWRKVETKNWVGFGPQEIGEDVAWGVSFFNKSEKTAVQIKDEAGKQFPDRKQTEETISFDGLSATKVITTTNQFADWYSVTIIIDSGNMLYAINNGAQTDKALNEMIAKRTGKSSNISFENFYTSFKQTNTSIPTITANVKKIGYSVPNGWVTSTDTTNSFQLSHDATKLKTCYPDQKGISLCAQYGSYISSSILPYDGGSRHQFIYNNGLDTPRKDELWSDYREQEYDLDGKSCLFLNGITISQYPAVWGMCAIDNSRAVLFTSYDRAESAYEAILKTFKVIK